MRAIKGTVKNGVIQPQESVNLSEGQTVIIVTMEEQVNQYLLLQNYPNSCFYQK